MARVPCMLDIDHTGGLGKEQASLKQDKRQTRNVALAKQNVKIMGERKKTLILVGLLVCSLFVLASSLNGNFQASATDVGPPPWRPWNVTGIQRLVVVCTEFLDVTHSVDSLTIRNRLYEMATYFYTVSSGQISVDLTVYDHWERLNKTMQYYGQDDASTHDVNVGNSLLTQWKRGTAR